MLNLLKVMIFPVVMYGGEIWTVIKVQSTEELTFKLWCWKRLLKSPLDSKEIKPIDPKGNQPEYSSEGLMLKMNLQYFGHLMQRANLLEKTLILGKIEGRRIRGWQRMRWFAGITDSMDMSLSKFQKILKDREVWHTAAHGVAESDMTEWLNNNSNKLR